MEALIGLTVENIMADPRSPDPRNPADPSSSPPDTPFAAPHTPYSDPAADPLIIHPTPVPPRSSAGGWIAAGVVAALVVIAALAFTSGPSTDPATTAVIPDQTDNAVPTPNASPAIPGEDVAPEGTTPAAPAPAEAPTAQPPAAN